MPSTRGPACGWAWRFFREVAADRVIWSTLALLLTSDAAVLASRAVRKWDLVELVGLDALADAGASLIITKVFASFGIMLLGWWLTRSRAYAALMVACGLAVADFVTKLHLAVSPCLGTQLLPFDAHWTINAAFGKAVYFSVMAMLAGGVVSVAWQRSAAWERGLILSQAAVFVAAGAGVVGADLVRTLQKGIPPISGLALGRLELVVELLATSVALAMSLGILRATMTVHRTTSQQSSP